MQPHNLTAQQYYHYQLQRMAQLPTPLTLYTFAYPQQLSTLAQEPIYVLVLASVDAVHAIELARASAYAERLSHMQGRYAADALTQPLILHEHTPYPPVWQRLATRPVTNPYLNAPMLQLSVRASDFEWQVWQCLAQCKALQQVSYSDVAYALDGHTKRVRAVASAIGRNPLSVLVPCHLVLRKQGQLGGYAWGLDVKRALLQHLGCVNA